MNRKNHNFAIAISQFFAIHFTTILQWINRGASFWWSFGPLSAWGSIESMTILTTHPSLFRRYIRLQSLYFALLAKLWPAGSVPEFSSPWRKQFFHKKVISNFDIICRFHGKEKRMSHFWNSDSRLTWMIHLKIISEREILLSGKYENERKTSSSLSTDKLNISRIWNIEWKTIQRCYWYCNRGNHLECDASCIQNLFFLFELGMCGQSEVMTMSEAMSKPVPEIMTLSMS